MTGPGPDKRKSMMAHESIRVPINQRDASNISACPWKNSPTLISIPAPGDRVQRSRLHDDSYSQNHQQHRRHSNPYSSGMTNNTLRNRRPGNPNVRQTVLAIPPDEYSNNADSRVWKRPRLDTFISSTIPTNGASSSCARGPAPRSNAPEIQAIESTRATHDRRNFVPKDAEIIDIGASSEDLGEPVPTATRSSSPDPILLTHDSDHPFHTRPTEYSSSNKGKGRAKEPEFVEGSEEDEEIHGFTPPPPRPSSVKKSREIPVGVVHERKKIFERPPSSMPAAVRLPIGKSANSVDLTTTGRIVSRMKGKDEGAPGHQRTIGAFDYVGTSSSNFTNSTREKEKTLALPLKAWCLGQHYFEYSESSPLKLIYELSLRRITVTWGQSSTEVVAFKLDRDISSAMVVNDSEKPLKQDVVVQFRPTPGSVWEEAERKYKGFKAGGERGREILTFLFSTAKDRGPTTTDYQQFVTGIKKALQPSVVETIPPVKGRSIWDFVTRHAAMFSQAETRSKQKHQSEGVVEQPLAPARSVTPCSSASVKIGLESNPWDGDSVPSTSRRRSARQSAIRSLRASPLPPSPSHVEPDEVVLMYPASGTGALNIMNSDLRRLQPEEYLNDTLIEFGLKLWLSDLREKDRALADQIHVFSSFFYKKLNNKKNPEDGYQSVRKWTSKVELFEKKYIIVPINENIHWYLAIIYEPGHMLEPPLLLSQSQLSHSRTTRKQKQKQESAKAHSETLTEVSLERLSPAANVTEGGPEADASSMDATCATTPSVTENEGMDDDAINVFDKSCSITATDPAPFEMQIRDSSPNLLHPPSDSMDIDVNISVTDTVPNATREVAEVLGPLTSTSSGIPVRHFYGSTRKSGDAQSVVVEDNEDSGEDLRQEAEVDNMLAVTPSQTYIFTLDSLGTRHPQAIKVLKQYLKSEAKDKRDFDEVRDAVGKQVQVPVQPNTWDCGIYLLHFVKVFMNAPSEFVERILSTRSTVPSAERKKMWQDHEVPQYRDYLKSRIIQLSDDWKDTKTREEKVNKRRNEDAMGIDAISSEGEVDIVEDLPSVKATPAPKQKQPAARLRG